MIEKRTVVDQVEILRTGHIQVRLGLLLLEDGREIDCKWHRFSAGPERDVDAQIAAVNAHLAEMGRPEVDAEGVSLIRAVVEAVHSPEAKAGKGRKA